MWALLLAFGISGGLVKLAWGQAVEPTITPAWRKEKLARLAAIKRDKLTLDQAEDGAVLARHFGSPKLETEFKKTASKLKKIMKTKGGR